MSKKRRIFGYQIPGGFTINVNWMLGGLLVIWVGWAIYAALSSAAEVSRANLKLTAVYRDKSIQEEMKQELEERARIVGVEVPGTPTPTPEPGVVPTREVLVPSREALLKEEMRFRRLVKSGERIIPLPELATGVPVSGEPSSSPSYTPQTPLEAWKLLLGLGGAGQR